MTHRLSQNARHTNELLQELERDKELDVLREYLTRYNLFPHKRDPASAPIRFEELKELVKHWKLHRQRNFWKTHTTKDDLVRTLYRHINTKVIPQEARQEAGGNGAPGSPLASGGAAVVGPNALGEAGPVPPTSPVRRPTMASQQLDSPRTKSILKGVNTLIRALHGPNSENIFTGYNGDLFGQRGDYEDGMIYLSRFRKPMSLEVANVAEILEGNQDPKREIDYEEESGDIFTEHHEGVSGGLPREVRLKQECAFSIYHFTTEAGNEKKMMIEGCMPAISRLATFDDIEVKKYCAAAILNLTSDGSLCQQMIEEGVLLALLELAKAQNEEIRRNTSMALCRFSYEKTGQHRLVQEGCVSAIISMLNSPDYDTKEACIKALINIASFHGTSVAESVVQSVLKLAGRKESHTLRFATEVIFNLSLLTGPRAKVVEDGVLDNVHDLVRSSGDPDVKLNLATALCNFSGLPSNLEMLSQVRILDCIEDLLKFDDENVREMCAITIANVSSYPSSLKNLVLSDAVVQLVEMGQKANHTIQENTALSLSNMSSTAESRPLLARFGVVTLLLHFLEESTILAKQYAIVALCSLMVNPATCSELIQSNIPGVLAKLSSSTNEKVKELCAHALFNLSCDKGLHSFLLKEDVISAVMRLCKKFTMNKEGVEVEEDSTGVKDAEKSPITLLRNQEYALGSLYNLSFFEEGRKGLIRYEIIAILCNLFHRPVKNDDLVRQCAAIVANLTFEVDARTRLVSDGVVRLIRKLMLSTQKETLLCCSTALCNIATDALEKTPILSMLIDLSASPQSAIKLTCAIAFSKLASNSTYRSVLTKTPELYPALTVMMRCGIEDIQIYSAVALCNLAIERGQRSKHIWKEGTVPDFIVNSLLRINSDSTKEICARALYNLLTHDEHRLSHIKEGVLYALVKLARLESIEIRSLCVTALYNLSCDPTMIDILMEINVAQVITKMCEIEFSNLEIHRRLAACMTNVALKTGNEVKLVEGGALMAVLALSEHNDPQTIRYCASVLCSLSCQRSNCEAMASSNLVEVLAKIISSEDNQQNVFGLNALCNISCLPALHSRIEESGAITQMIRLLSISEDEDILLASTRSLCNLTYHPKYRKVMLQQDLIDVLQKVFLRDPISPRVVEACARIVGILCEDPTNWRELIQKGAVKVLRVISPHCNAASMLDCIYSLSQLARCENNGLTVLMDGAIDIVASTIPIEYDPKVDPQVPEDVAERCSVIFRTLSTFPDCLSPLMDDTRFIPIMRAIIFAKQKDTCRNCVLTLYNISSNKSGCVEKLLKGGVIKLLIELAYSGGNDMTQACAVALAHIKHMEDDANAQTDSTATPLMSLNDALGKTVGSDDMESGIVETLISMIDLDQISIQKIDRLAAALPTALVKHQSSEWSFFSGDFTIRVGSQLPVSWTFRNSAIDDERFIPAEPKTFLSMLTPVVPEIGSSVQEKLYGAFRIMRVREEKCRVKKLDPKLLRGSSLREVVSTAIESSGDDDKEGDFATSASTGEGSDVSKEKADGDGIDGDEVRQATTVRKKTTTKVMSPTGSQRGSISDFGGHGHRSTINKGIARRGSRNSFSPEKRLSRQDSKNSDSASSIELEKHDRTTILPKL